MSHLFKRPRGLRRGYFNLPVALIMLRQDRYVVPQLALNGLYHLLLWVIVYHQDHLTQEPSNDLSFQLLLDRLYEINKSLYACDYMYGYDEISRGPSDGIEFDPVLLGMGSALEEISVFSETVPAPEETWQGILAVLSRFYHYRRSWNNDFNRPRWGMRFFHLLEKYHTLPFFNEELPETTTSAT